MKTRRRCFKFWDYVELYIVKTVFYSTDIPSCAFPCRVSLSHPHRASLGLPCYISSSARPLRMATRRMLN